MKQQKHRHRRIASPVVRAGSVVLAISAAAACGGEEPHEPESAAADACEHMRQGPYTAAAAVPVATADGPDLDTSHVRYDIALGAAGGYVDLVVAGAGEYTLFLGVDRPLELTTADGKPIAPERSQAGFAECSEIALGVTYDLQVGTHRLRFAPGAAGEVRLVWVQEGAHEHDEG
jgi:hypothetical protein